MVAEARAWVDVEIAVREWARDSVESVGRRVFFGVDNNAAMPQIAMSRISGPDSACLIQFDCWAKGKAAAAALAAELATAADELSRYEHEGVLLHGADPFDLSWQPDEESNTPRYVVQVLFTATAR